MIALRTRLREVGSRWWAVAAAVGVVVAANAALAGAWWALAFLPAVAVYPLLVRDVERDTSRTRVAHAARAAGGWTTEQWQEAGQ